MSLLLWVLSLLSTFTLAPQIHHPTRLTIHTTAYLPQFENNQLGWDVTVSPPAFRPGEADVTIGVPDCGNEGPNWACTRTQIRDGQVIWAGIVMSPDIPLKNRQWVVLHELGHAFGLDHTGNPNDVMYPGAGTRTTYSPGDRAGIEKLR